MKNYKEIQRMIETALDRNKGGKIAICPFGENGLVTKEILNKCYGINEVAIIDNKLSKWNSGIMSVDDLAETETENWTILLNSTVESVNYELESQIERVIPGTEIVNIMAPIMVEEAGKREFYLSLRDQIKTRNIIDHELVRMGSIYDGGYILVNDFAMVKKAYSFGIGMDIAWEEKMADIGNMEIFMYDPTIRKVSDFNPRFHFFSQGIAGTDSLDRKYLSMESILKENGDLNNKNLILKMDVEGAEYDFILNTEETIIDNFMQMSFEFHGITVNEKENMVLRTFEKLNKTHFPVWIHANNNGKIVKIGQDILPDLLELTYVNKRLYKYDNSKINYPINLDSPNIRTRKEIILGTW